MSIIDSVRKLAEKVGADTNGRTIADQLNIINKKLDDTQPGSRDIAEAVSKFADKEDGTAILVTKTITENGTYKASDDDASGYSSVSVDVNTPTLGIVTGDFSSAPPGQSSSLNGSKFFVIIATPDNNGVVSYKNWNKNQTRFYSHAFVYGENVKKINIKFAHAHSVTFKAGENFEGFFAYNNEITPTGEQIVAGNWYNALFQDLDNTYSVVVETNASLGYTVLD